MKKSIAFVFKLGPHGSSAGREGLDALLATAAFVNDIGIFFISDGVFLLLTQQQPKQILARNFIATFGILSLYDINKIYICSDSVDERGLNYAPSCWVIKAKFMPATEWRQQLDTFDLILTF